MTLVADNQGAHYCMGCKTGGTRYPCRWCSNNSSECLFDTPTTLRDDANALRNQRIAWVGFGKQVRGLPATVSETRLWKILFIKFLKLIVQNHHQIPIMI